MAAGEVQLVVRKGYGEARTNTVVEEGERKYFVAGGFGVEGVVVKAQTDIAGEQGLTGKLAVETAEGADTGFVWTVAEQPVMVMQYSGRSLQGPRHWVLGVPADYWVAMMSEDRCPWGLLEDQVLSSLL
jgi:hypothetical protein